MGMVKRYIASILILVFILASLTPTFYEWGRRNDIKPIRTFELVHNFPTDYEFYLSRIREGKEGAWLATEKYTSEPHAPSLSQVLYVFIGRVSDWAHIQTPFVWFSYHAMRVFFAALVLLVLWKMVEWLKVGILWQVIIFILAATASTWPKFEMVDGWPRFGGYMPWYSLMDSMQRITFLPHVLFGMAMLAFILWVFAGGFITKKHIGNWVFLGCIGIVLGIVFPPALLFIYGVLLVLTIWEIGEIFLDRAISSSGKKKALTTWAIEKFSGRFIFGLMSGPTFIYYSLLFTQYPWKRLVEFDVLHPTQFSYMEYFLAVGPVLPLGLLGIVAVLLTRKSEMSKKLTIFVVWVVTWLLFMFIFNFIPAQSPTRFTQMLPHVPLAILTGYLCMQLPLLASSLLKKSELAKNEGLIAIGRILPIVIILFAFGTMASSFMWQKDFVDHKLRADIPLVPLGADVMYPLKDLTDAMIWLQVNTPRSAVVLSGMGTGNLIPVYSGNTAFLGHANTVDSETKEIAVANFYRQTLPLAEEMDFLKTRGIGYIIFGPEERDIAGGVELSSLYPALSKTFENGFVQIFKVN